LHDLGWEQHLIQVINFILMRFHWGGAKNVCLRLARQTNEREREREKKRKREREREREREKEKEREERLRKILLQK
jgi:hypothetical protein